MVATLVSAMAIAMSDPVRNAFTVLGTGQGRNLGVRDPVSQDPQGLPEKVQVSVHSTLAWQLDNVHPVFGHLVPPCW